MHARRMIRITKVDALVVAVLALTGGVAARAVAAPKDALDDAAIVRHVLALSRAEERAADAVKGKLVSTAVWQLAQRISVDQAALDLEFESLAPVARPQGGARAAVAGPDPDLTTLTGDELEKAYVDREVRSQQAMLATLDRELIPAAKGEQLQRSLGDLREEVAAHLLAAENVQHAEWVRQTIEQQRADISKEIGNSGP